MDFLTSEDPFNFQSELLSYAEDGGVYDVTAFKPYVYHAELLMDVLLRARQKVLKRVVVKKCKCASPAMESFDHVLEKTFSNKTLYAYLLNGDAMELDTLKIDIEIYNVSFDPIGTLTAYHKVRELIRQLKHVYDKLLINPFAWN